MRILADENLHTLVVTRLREAGHELEWIRETWPGTLDREILARADIASFILITHDRDFGDLIFNQGLPTPYAILYSRLPHRLLRKPQPGSSRCLKRGSSRAR